MGASHFVLLFSILAFGCAQKGEDSESADAAGKGSSAIEIAMVEDAEIEACQTNTKTIAVAVQANHVRNRTAPYWKGTVDADVASGALDDLQNAPVCPGDGSFYVVTIPVSGEGFHVACGDASHEFSWENGVFLTAK